MKSISKPRLLLNLPKKRRWAFVKSVARKNGISIKKVRDYHTFLEAVGENEKDEIEDAPFRPDMGINIKAKTIYYSGKPTHPFDFIHEIGHILHGTDLSGEDYALAYEVLSAQKYRHIKKLAKHRNDYNYGVSNGLNGVPGGIKGHYKDIRETLRNIKNGHEKYPGINV